LESSPREPRSRTSRETGLYTTSKSSQPQIQTADAPANVDRIQYSSESAGSAKDQEQRSDIPGTVPDYVSISTMNNATADYTDCADGLE